MKESILGHFGTIARMVWQRESGGYMGLFNTLSNIASAAGECAMGQSEELNDFVEKFEGYSDEELLEISRRPGSTKRILAAKMVLSQRGE